jgi:hypothetical protein
MRVVVVDSCGCPAFDRFRKSTSKRSLEDRVIGKKLSVPKISECGGVDDGCGLNKYLGVVGGGGQKTQTTGKHLL